jgi:putative transposase
MLKGVKVRLYPNKNQELYINKLLGSYRFVFNKCLERKIAAYNTDKTSLSLGDLSRYFHGELTKQVETYFLQEHNTKVLNQSILDLTDAYKRFFVNGNGFPKFKSRKDRQSARFSREAISRLNDFMTGKINLVSKLKKLKFECSNKDKKYLNKYKSGIKSATLSRDNSGNFFLSILIDGDVAKTFPSPINNIIGLDFGIKDFIVGSDGSRYANIKSTRNNQKRLSKLQREISKKVLGSSNREKSRKRLAVYQKKLNNKKINYIHNITSKIVRENQTIVIEDLNVKGMMQNHKMARSIQELSLSETRRQLEYKASWYERNLVVVDRFFPSSKLCSDCGYKYKNLSLNERRWICPECGVEHDRDENASKNLEKEGERILSMKE